MQIWTFPKKSVAALSTALMAASLSVQPVTAVPSDPGVTDSQILIGSCLSQTGQLHRRGAELTKGATAYFEYINAKGGVNGRKIKLKSCDDAYDAEKAEQCFNENLHGKVFAGAFFLGSVPALKYARLAPKENMPLIGFSSGLNELYEFQHDIFTLRPSYVEEVNVQISELAKHGAKRFAILYVLDAYGFSIRSAATAALKRLGITPVLQANYERNTSNLDAAFAQIKAQKPDVLILGVASALLPQVMQKKQEQKLNTVYVCPSVAMDVIRNNFDDANDILVTDAMPNPLEKAPGIILYQSQLKKIAPAASFDESSLEGFMVATVIVEGLKRAGRDLSRAKFMSALESVHDQDFGFGDNFKVSFSSTNHNGIDARVIRFLRVDSSKQQLVPIGTDSVCNRKTTLRTGQNLRSTSNQFASTVVV